MFCQPKNRKDSFDKLYTKQFFKTNKLLLLGTGESGKTTIIKQMKILHINGFTDQDRQEKIPFIKNNVHESIYAILDNMTKINPPERIESEISRESVEYLLSLPPNFNGFSEEYYESVKAAWKDSGVQKAYNRSNEYQLIDCAEHFLNRIDEIRKIDYIPTTQDILYCRITTVSISKIEFTVDVDKKYGGGQAEFWMYDVGGQRGERKKWIQVFDGIEAILFLIAASDFDQTLREDTSRNRLAEALSLFEDIYGSRFVRNSGLIVFLNKQDILKRKIEQGRSLAKYFPEFETFQPNQKDCDINNEYEKAKFFMKKKILDIARPLRVEHVGYIPGKLIHEELPKREVYVHFTVATDTNNIRHVFESVQEIILKKNIAFIF